MDSTAAPTRMTAEEFVRKHGGEYVEQLDGIVEPIPMPEPLHGHVCFNAAYLIGGHIREQKLGIVCSNDTFVLVRRNPDRVRGADMAYWSRPKLPEGKVPQGLIEAPPDLCVEVLSPTNDRSGIFIKVGEHRKAGVAAVLVFDPESATASVYRKDEFQQVFDNGDDLTIPDVLPGLTVPVKRFFE